MIGEGNEDQALSQLHSLLQEAPDDPELLNTLGSIYARRGDLAKAESILNEVIGLDPEYADGHYNLGLVHSRQNRKSEAVEDFQQAIKINPRISAAHNDLGMIYKTRGEMDLAKGHFIKALEANPLYKSALVNLFEICLDDGAYSEGLNRIENFLRVALNGKQPQAVDNILPSVTERTTMEQSVVPDACLSLRTDTKRILTVKKKSSSLCDELFLKHVPDDLRDKKSGNNIAVVADFNVAGQLSLLFRMINRYTTHKARLIILQGDYLSYDKDLILSSGNQQDYEEAVSVIENADFHHIGRFPKNFNDINWANILRPDNCLVQYYGSEMRNKAEHIYRWHKENKITGLSTWDYTMLENAPLFYHINMMCDFSRVKQCSPPREVVRICHLLIDGQSEKTAVLLDAYERLKRKYRIELELIEGKSNEECLDIKSRCHITYDQLSAGIYGLSAIESMAAGHAVLCGISNFAASYHPDNPVVYVTEENLYDRMDNLLKSKKEIIRIGNTSRIWARMHHDPMKIIRQYLWIYDFVLHGHRHVEDPNSYLLN
ncbi:MAG: tetratricopeptide repeat protein [candidate division Zixibacteria bacterium]